LLKNHSDSTKKFAEIDIINMLELLIDNNLLSLVDVFFNRQSTYLWVPHCQFRGVGQGMK
jgi:hypothetical protein